jgi:ribosomal protein S18 acetylase RimI-like enzyme
MDSHCVIVVADLAMEPHIAPLMEAFYAEEGIEWVPETMIPALRALLAAPDLGIVCVARDLHSGAIVGYGIAAFGYDIEFSGRDAAVTDLFVGAAHRGCGVGRALLDALVHSVNSRQARALHLMVRPDNAPARALYERSGFQPVPRVLMTKPLVAP